MSFGNNLGLIKAFQDQMPEGSELIVFYRPNTEAEATELAAYGVRTIPFRDNMNFVLNGLPLLMTARVLFCDNYYAFLGGLAHPHKMRIVQLWHANGAIKQFGWEDPATSTRSSADQRRFQAVYDQFDEYVVASKMMARVFENSYHVPASRMEYLGYPRSDRLFNAKWRKRAQKRVYRLAPELKGRRVLLYAPTYREGITYHAPKGMREALLADPNAIAVVKLHPLLTSSQAQLTYEFGSRVKFYDQLTTTDLLTVAETVVTDYSSVAFDYSLLPNAHSLLFFMFDLDDYQNNPGIQKDLLDWLPSEPLKTVDDLEHAVVLDSATDFKDFNQNWNTYNDGHATKRVTARYLALLQS
ncbi:CDP-glycerol--poly(glycerophosphate) glycerophosphotransferase [Levilactobacillus bambusae]|uniref:CDP-glycerol--poly(Glycerophosphate) glycerophosphotransferase n=2 Tax=Levilactobacillus bambusae TaxID=2024736 RepID=A0A2V1N1I4_9LACO|nr:CDP-glycerol--poly(glycerophosphate) glycerophosphotransferase [Levilactobacillus bambusae]